MILQTERLYLRELQDTDFDDLCEILQDQQVMYAYEHAFDHYEVQQWLQRQQQRYREDGFGLWAIILKSTGELIGQAGLTWQTFCEGQVLEIGYLLKKRFWHCGYATEAAIGCKQYAFDHLGQERVYSIIRDNNWASQQVARRNNMELVGRIVKHYYHMDMPHDVYCVQKGS